MLAEIKKSMRITHDALDSEIAGNIDTALLELSRVGISVEGITSTSANSNKLIQKACELYCKWQMDYMGKGEQFQKNFNSLSDALSLCEQYKGADDE